MAFEIENISGVPGAGLHLFFYYKFQSYKIFGLKKFFVYDDGFIGIYR